MSMNSRHHVLLTLAALSLFSCSKGGGDPKPSPIQETDPSPLSTATRSGAIYFDSALSQKERGAFVTAMNGLDQDGLAGADQTLLDMMQSRGDAASVRQWLEDRVQIIVTAATDDKKLVEQKDSTFVYANPDHLPNSDGVPTAGVHDDSVSTIMLNIGAGLYAAGKKAHSLYTFQADGIGTLQLTSPRAGILMVGEGLFEVPAKFPNAVRIFHQGTLLHEARHSDGNKEGAGFFHAICTSDDLKQYKGKAACDHNLNGPYTIGALSTKALLASCAGCSTVEKNGLYEIYLDYKSRVIFDNATTAWDPTSEGSR